jgi:Tfp pilus assembly protein PilE
MIRLDARGLSAMELVILLAALGSLVVLAVPMIATMRSRPAIETMRANLMALAAAQESHFYDVRSYAGDPEALRRTGFAPTDGVLLVIREATRSGWSAFASHPATQVQCFLYVRDAAPAGSAREPGAVHCS